MQTVRGAAFTNAAQQLLKIRASNALKRPAFRYGVRCCAREIHRASNASGNEGQSCVVGAGGLLEGKPLLLVRHQRNQQAPTHNRYRQVSVSRLFCVHEQYLGHCGAASDVSQWITEFRADIQRADVLLVHIPAP